MTNQPAVKPVRRKVLSFYRAYNRKTKTVEARWRLRGANGSLIDSSNDGFARVSTAERNAALTLSNGGKVLRNPDTDTGVLEGREDIRVEWEAKGAEPEGLPRALRSAKGKV